MNKNVFWIIIAILVIVIGGYLILNQGIPQEPTKESGEKAGAEDINSGVGEMQEADSMMEDDSMLEDDSAMMEAGSMTQPEAGAAEEDKMMEARPGSYEAYDESKLVLADTGAVILFFKAGWCPTCLALDRDINANLLDIPENAHILTIDYDTATELKKKYGITYQHTFVQVDAQGNQIKKWSGSPTLSSLLSQIQ